jgi:hypothetical protein
MKHLEQVIGGGIDKKKPHYNKWGFKEYGTYLLSRDESQYHRP